ncbi:MAG: carotenoid biosynthesis protein [Alphaproteobacteria bacterium]|nr:carotenoid biosynthesis protein [Alphaproteobacteria bacterium]
MPKILAIAFALLFAAILWQAGQAPMQPLPQIIAAITILVVFGHAVRALGAVNALGFLGLIAAITFAVENLGTATGFWFGDYHFVVGADLPHVGRIPLIVGFLYFATGYCAYICGLLITSGRAGKVSPLAVSLAGALAMTQWDLVMDPVNSTHYGLWIWHHGGAFFGVPVTNFLGWFVEIIAFLAVTIFLRARGAQFDFAARPRSFWLVPIALYLAAGLSQVAPWLLAPDGSVTDGAGVVWRIRDLHEAAVLVALLTMVPTSLLALYRLART